MDVILLETIFGIISLLAIICFFNNCGRKDKQIETPPIAKQDQDLKHMEESLYQDGYVFYKQLAQNFSQIESVSDYFEDEEVGVSGDTVFPVVFDLVNDNSD